MTETARAVVAHMWSAFRCSCAREALECATCQADIALIAAALQAERERAYKEGHDDAVVDLTPERIKEGWRLGFEAGQEAERERTWTEAATLVAKFDSTENAARQCRIQAAIRRG